MEQQVEQILAEVEEMQRNFTRDLEVLGITFEELDARAETIRRRLPSRARRRVEAAVAELAPRRVARPGSSLASIPGGLRA